MIDEAIDAELEARLRIAFDEMIPKLLESNSASEVLGDLDDSVFDDVPNEVAVRHLPVERRSPRSLVAAGLLVAACVAGLLAVAQRDDDSAASTDTGTNPAGTSTVVPDGTIPAEPPWFQLMRPLVPERFEYLALVVRDPLEMHVVAVDADDGKALEIGLVPVAEAPSQETATTSMSPYGFWTESPQGWQLRVPRVPNGLAITITCDIGARGRDFAGPPNYCDMTSTGAFTKDEIRSVVEAFANLDTSVFETDIGVPTDHDVNPAAASAMIADALPGQTLMSDTDWGHGDRVFDFGSGGDRPDTSVRVLQNLYPRPPTDQQTAFALYDDAAAVWMLGADGVAVRISTTDTSPEALGRFEQLGAALLAEDELVTRPSLPAPSTTIIIPTTASPTTFVDTTTVLPPQTTIFRNPTGPHLLPTAMPPGFDDIADGYTTDTEGADPETLAVRMFLGAGGRPGVVVMFSTPASDVGADVELGLRDMTTSSDWPSFGLGVVHPSGRYDWFRSGGVTADDLQLLADYVTVETAPDPNIQTSTETFTEVTWTHAPLNAHGITWNGPGGQTITMYAEANHGVDALSNGMTWSIEVFDTPVGRVFASVDATDASFVQVGLVVDGQVINFEAQHVAVDDVVAMAASIQPADDADWNRRIVG